MTEYERIKEVALRNHRPEWVVESLDGQGNPMLTIKDNGDICFYFDKDKKLTSIRSY